MNNLIQTRCDLLADNRSLIAKKYTFENNLMCIAAALIYTAADASADTEKLTECKKTLKKHTGVFSKLRSITELVLLCKMALSENPEEYLETLKSVCTNLKRAGFDNNSYLVQASMLICDLDAQDDSETIASKAKEIMKRLNKAHPLLTSSEDMTSVVLLAMSYKDVDTVLSDLDAGYDYFTNTYKLGLPKNSIQELCEILAVSYGDMDSKCDIVARIYNCLRQHKAYFAKGTMFATLGLLADTGLTPDELAEEIMEAAEYLKGKDGFYNKEDDQESEKRRMMYAVLLIACACGGDSDIVNNPAIGNAISDITAKKIATAVTFTLNIAGSLIPALLGGENEE